jgi:3-oxoadipate enol-lactonase
MAASVELHCEVQGKGPDLVLLHPAGLDRSFMAALAREAAGSHRVLGIDLRGHGLSPDAAPSITLDDHAADVAAALTVHGRGPAVVLGLSLGGMVAQMLALRQPGRLAGLVLCGCTGGFSAELQPLLRERGLAAQRGGMAGVTDATLERWFTPAFLANPAVSLVRERLLHDKPSNWSATWNAIAGFNALPRLGELRLPALVIGGERDAATPLAATDALARAIPGARHHVLAGAPHMMQIECAQAFNQAVLDFVRGPAP